MLAATLGARGFVPLLCGAVAQLDLAAEVKARLRRAAPSAVILDDFLGPAALGAIYSATLLNIHPCLYDAYGMSVVEAAAFGAPSVVNSGGAVGATALLAGSATADDGHGAHSGASGCLEMDFGAGIEAIAAAVQAALDDVDRLAVIAQSARECALGWSEAAAGKLLYRELEEITSAC